MLSDQFDKKIKEAADHHHPAYDQKAWTWMEKLLDKHLPREKDDRRRFIFFLLFFLLLGGGAWIYFGKSFKGKTAVMPDASRMGQLAEKLNKEPVTTKNDGVVEKIISGQPVIQPGIQTAIENIDKRVLVQKKKDVFHPVIGDPDKKSITISKDPEPVPVTPKNEFTDIKKEEPAISKNENLLPVIKEDKVKKDDAVITKTPDEPQKKKQGPKKSSAFFFTISGGPDLSTAGFGGQGKVKMLGGIGVGYTYREKFTLRSGFYTGRKVYSANPDEYHGSAAFYTYYPNLQWVNANCKVYEIPISLSYNFGHNSKQNWFASAGISTYLMKKETYDFYYKYTATSPTVSREWTVNNENKHYFSVVTLSGGYQCNLGKTFSIMAEPYLKLPLSGVGLGKVKLNSMGVLFTLGVKPFQPKGKK